MKARPVFGEQGAIDDGVEPHIDPKLYMGLTMGKDPRFDWTRSTAARIRVLEHTLCQATIDLPGGGRSMKYTT